MSSGFLGAFVRFAAEKAYFSTLTWQFTKNSKVFLHFPLTFRLCGGKVLSEISTHAPKVLILKKNC